MSLLLLKGKFTCGEGTLVVPMMPLPFTALIPSPSLGPRMNVRESLPLDFAMVHVHLLVITSTSMQEKKKVKTYIPYAIIPSAS